MIRRQHAVARPGPGALAGAAPFCFVTVLVAADDESISDAAPTCTAGADVQSWLFGVRNGLISARREAGRSAKVLPLDEELGRARAS
jgi:hypothetical protein